MSTLRFEVPFYIYKVDDHIRLKPILLDMIEKAEGHQSVRSYERLGKTDWYLNVAHKDFMRRFISNSDETYYSVLKPHIENIIDSVLPEDDKSNIYVYHGWYNQYLTMNHYFYHAHFGAKWAMVYYLELPINGPKTEFENFFGDPIVPNVDEGDILIFPAWIKHRSPHNKSMDRKTIIAFNLAEKESTV